MNEHRPVKCGDCNWTGTEDTCVSLVETPDLWDRIDPGPVHGEVPAGSCPEPDCGSLVYLDDEVSNKIRTLNKAVPVMLPILIAAELLIRINAPITDGSPMHRAIKEVLVLAGERKS